MPTPSDKFETDKLKIPREKDKRVKLSLEDREEIKRQYGKVSQRKLAKAWGVSRRLIQFIGDPEKKKRDLYLRKMRGGSKAYYDKDKHTKAMRKHRRHKKELHLKGELIEEVKQ